MKYAMVRDIIEPDRNNLTLLRLIAALSVLVSHALLLRSGTRADEFSGTSVYNLGDHAVNVFFVLSGLTVAASLARCRNSIDFIIARALRIFPGLIVCTIVIVASGLLLSECGVADYLKDARVLEYMVKTISLSTGAAELPGLFRDNPYPSVVNGSLWTLKFEFLCYLLLALMGSMRLLTPGMMTKLLPIGFVAAAVFLAYRHGGQPDQLEQFARFWLSFSFGVALFLFRDRIVLSWGVAVGLGAAMWFVLGTGLERTVAPIAIGYLAVVLGTVRLRWLRHATNKQDLSYGVYIYSWPISQAVLTAWPDVGTANLICLSALLAMGIAALSWRLVERPSLNARKRVYDLVATPFLQIRLSR